MEYKKINELIVKEHFKKNSQLLIGDYEGEYIILPEDDYVLISPKSKILCDLSKLKEKMVITTDWLRVDRFKNKDGYHMAEPTGNIRKSKVGTKEVVIVEYKAVDGEYSTYVDESKLKLFGGDYVVMVHEKNTTPITIWDESQEILLGAICTIVENNKEKR